MTLRPPRLAGHPLHPMLVGLPLGLWLGSVAWDLVALLRPGPTWPQLAFWTLALGTAAALPTAATGFWELAALPGEPRVERTAWWHLGWMSAALALFAVSLLLRWKAPDLAAPPAPAIVLSAAGAAATVAGGWFGGELVFRHGVGVAPERPATAASDEETD